MKTEIKLNDLYELIGSIIGIGIDENDNILIDAARTIEYFLEDNENIESLKKEDIILTGKYE